MMCLCTYFCVRQHMGHDMPSHELYALMYTTFHTYTCMYISKTFLNIKECNAIVCLVL